MSGEYITQQETFEANVLKMQKEVARLLASFKSKHRCSNETIGKEIGVGPKTISNILNGETAVIRTEAYWRLLLLLKIDHDKVKI